MIFCGKHLVKLNKGVCIKQINGINWESQEITRFFFCLGFHSHDKIQILKKTRKQIHNFSHPKTVTFSSKTHT